MTALGYTLVLVNSDDDIILTTKNMCRKCFSSKLSVEILKEYDISEEKSSEYLKDPLIRKVKIVCECPKM